MFYAIDDVMWIFSHNQIECEKYIPHKYFQLHKTLLWIWIILRASITINSGNLCSYYLGCVSMFATHSLFHSALVIVDKTLMLDGKVDGLQWLFFHMVHFS